MNLQLIHHKLYVFSALLLFAALLSAPARAVEEVKPAQEAISAPENAPQNAPASAKKEDEETRITIPVDEIDKDILVAKNRAHHQAEMRGLWQVLERIDAVHAKEIYGSLSAEDIHAMVENLTPTHEAITGGRYRADIMIKFDALKIRALKRQNEVAAPSTSDATGAGTLLIIPIMQSAKGELLIWQENNLWRDALNSQTLELGKGKLVMPFGDPTDNLLLDQEAVLAGDVKALQSAATRYGTRGAVIALAKIRAANPKMTILTADIFLRRAGATNEEVTLHYESEPGESLDKMLTRAAQEVTRKLSNSVNQFALFEEAAASRIKGLVMRVEYDTPDKWLSLRKYLEDQPSVSYLEVGAVSPSFAQVTIYYKGASSVIQQVLESQGTQVKDTGKFWVVTIPSKMTRN